MIAIKDGMLRSEAEVKVERVADTDPVYCDMERFNYCPILLTSETCIESFQFATATDSNVFGLTDVSLGRGNCGLCINVIILIVVSNQMLPFHLPHLVT